jgi:hypothetical protein
MNVVERANLVLERMLAVPITCYPRVLKHVVRRNWHSITAARSIQTIDNIELLKDFRVTNTKELIDKFSSREYPRFFFMRDATQRANYVSEQSPGLLNRVKFASDQAVAHRFDVLGSGLCDLGTKIPWCQDFKSGHEWSQMHFTKLKLVDLDAGFDVKVPWEVSRFHHLVTLGQGYALTSDELYASEFVSQIRDWWSDNPYEFGPNWANAMEVAIRSVNWIWAYELMCGSSVLDEQFVLDYIRSLCQHGRYIMRYLESGWPGSNHYIADLCGLIWLGIYLQPHSESSVWLKFGLDKLAEELMKQVHEDGSSYEGSTSYHILVTEMIFWTYAYCKMNDVVVPKVMVDRLIRMLDATCSLLRPDGEIPLIGDCDSGRWISLESDKTTLRTHQDARGLLVAGSVLFGRNDWCVISNQPQHDHRRYESALWAFGEDAVIAPDGLQAAECGSLSLPDSGWYVIRADENYMVIQAGENGSEGWGTHSHNDILSFELLVGRRPFIIDPGSYMYTGNYRARNMFRGTAAHNTVQIDIHETNRIPTKDMFRMSNDAIVKVHEWNSDDHSAWFDAEYVSQASGGKMIYHRRKYEYFHNFAYWVISDRAGYMGNDEDELSNITMYFHFSNLSIELDGLVARTCFSDGPNLAVFPLYKDVVGDSSAGIDAKINTGWVSSRYGVQEKAPILQYSMLSNRQNTMKTILLPFYDTLEFDSRCSEVLQSQRKGY